MMKILGIDLGEARVGLAISDELGALAHPLETIHLKSTPNAIGRITEIAAREKITTVVVGMPRNMNGTYGPAAEKAKAFGKKLESAAGVEVKFWDERMTSIAAQRALHESGRNVKRSRAVIDQVAAQIILQAFLDSQMTA
jgi:putative Holliday junction resolvase